MKFYFLFLAYFLCYSVLAQETRDWNVGISYGVGGSNVFLLPAIELDYKKNTFSIAPSRNTLALAYFRDFKYFGKKKNFTWIGSAVFISLFMSSRAVNETVWTPDYFNRPLSANGNYYSLLQSGLKANLMKRFYVALQGGVGTVSSEGFRDTDFTASLQLHLGVKLFKHSSLNK